LVEKLSKMGKEKNIKPLMKKYSLNINDYPLITENFQKKYLKYVLNSDGWMRCEEVLFDEIKVLELLIEEIWHKHMFSEAFSIAKRHNITKTLKNEELVLLFEQMESEKFEIIANELFESDSFNPTEENLASFKKGSFLNLLDFGITQKEIIFIDSMEGCESFQKELINSKMVC